MRSPSHLFDRSGKRGSRCLDVRADLAGKLLGMSCGTALGPM
jgi:hypothetical protein